MKNLILIIGIVICFAAVHTVFAQVEGTIHYEMKVNMHKTLPPDRAEMKDMIPEFNIHHSKLAFNDNESLYTNVEDEEDEEFGQEGGPRIRMRRPMNEYYYNRGTGKRITVQEFFGKHFLIEDSIKVLPWKLTNETKAVLGHNCKKATWYNEERKQNVVAWYAESLSPFIGPEIFNSLPGAVLQVDINDGERIITAEKIDSAKLEKGALKAPSKGQRTTEAEFRKMVEEQRRRMGGQGNIMIRN
jgi:GLPGLI family protein